MYWKNGVVVQLTPGNQSAQANAIYVVNNDVYVAGYEPNSNYWIAKYWKNGVAVDLTAGTEYAEATGIYVYGSDVYVSGHKDNHPVYWKNGVRYDLPGAIQNGYARDIAFSSSDVHLAGTVTDGIKFKAIHWKNDIATDLAPDSGVYEAHSIKLVDGDVYVGGFAAVKANGSNIEGAAYWKNGELHPVSVDADGNTMGFSVFVVKR